MSYLDKYCVLIGDAGEMQRLRERERQTDIVETSISDSPPDGWLPQSELGQGEARNQELLQGLPR